jgi:DNA repair protein RecO (recombination protein O)
VKRIASDALVARTVAYGESDVIVTLLTKTDGKLSALVRGGRKSARRVGGALEPFHTVHVYVDDRGGDLGTLREARIVRVRANIVSTLGAMEAAGLAMRWARHLFPPRHAEPRAWATLHALLDALDAGACPPRVALASAALRLLADVGYALDLERCVKCGKPCPPGRVAQVDAARGGLVCHACGGARRMLSPELRAVAIAAQRGETPHETPHETSEMTSAQADALLEMVDDAMAAHTGFEPG